MTHAQRIALAAKQFVRTPNGFLARHPSYGCVSFPDGSYRTFRAYTTQDPHFYHAVNNKQTGKPIAFCSFEAAVAALVD